MDNPAFFFQGDTLLLPASFPENQIEAGLPLELAGNFENASLIKIPAINNCAFPINAVSVPPDIVLPQGWQNIPVRQILTMFSAADGDPGSIMRAHHVIQWRSNSRFCGTCGAENTDSATEVQRICPRCGRSEFPRICPAIIVIITDDENRILLAHNKNFKTKIYSHISGFNEAGEALEETVVREVREEVNIELKDISYVKSQPWPFPNSLMLGFKARHLSGEIRPDGDEILDAKWFTKDSLPDLPGEGSLSRLLINRWLDGGL